MGHGCFPAQYTSDADVGNDSGDLGIDEQGPLDSIKQLAGESGHT